MYNKKIGIDLGGSHVGVGLIYEDKIIDLVERDFTKEDFNNIKETIVILIVEYIDTLLTRNKLELGNIEFIGVASPGTISNGVIKKAGNLNLKDFNLLEELKKYYNIPIKIRNDGKCAALAEKNYGAMKNYNDCVFMNIGTGIGGATFLEGKLLEPKKYSGFEFGHIIVEKQGRKCTCGKNGCFETYASMKSLRSQVAIKLGIDNNFSGKYLKDELLEKRYDEIQECIEEYTDYLALGIGNIIDIFEPEIVCFGGSFSYYKDTIIWERLMDKLEREDSTFNNNLPKFVVAELENNAGIIGATIE